MDENKNTELTQEEIERKERDERRLYIESCLDEMKEEAKLESEKEERKKADRRHFWNFMYFSLLILIIFGILAYLFANRDLIWV